MAKRTYRSRKGKQRRPIRQNRPTHRKKVIKREGFVMYRHRGRKIKSEEWEEIKL